VKASLQNIDDGFSLQIKNDLGPARIIGARPLQLDRKPIPLATCTFEHGGRSARFVDVDGQNSILMLKGEAVTVRVEGHELRPGWRTLAIHVIVKDMGSLSITVSDQAR
jgi:hypothetical protein